MIKNESNHEDLLEGRNAVIEALKAGRAIDKVFLASGNTDATLRRISYMAKQSGAAVSYCDRRRLDAMSKTGVHQGVLASVAATSYCTIDDILKSAAQKSEPPLIILCDEIMDPHNLGAILRTAECAGAHGVIIPKHRNSGLTSTVAKASAGALEYIPVARVSNLAAAIKVLKKEGIWVYGAAADGTQSVFQTDWTGPAAIVIGSEGSGMGRIISESCDFLISIPMNGHITSLNASNAAAILLYEAMRQRMGHTPKG